MAKKNETTTKFKADISELKSAFQQAQKAVAIANSEFKAATAGMDKWNKSADGLSAKIKQLNTVLDAENKKLESLEEQYKLTAQEQGANSKGAQDLLIKLNNQKAAVANVEKQIRNYNTQLDNLVAQSAESETASDKLKNTISEQESELKKLKDNYADLVLEQGKTSDAAKEAADKITALSQTLNDHKSKLSDAEGAADDLAGEFNNVDTAARNSSDGFTVAKGAMADLVADGIELVLGKLKDMITELANAEGAYNNFQAQTGKTTEEMAAFKDEIDEIYKSNLGESLDDVSDAMAKVAQNSKETDPTKIKELTENALVLRDTFGYDVTESMRAVNMLMDQFGLTGDEAFNLIVQGAQKGLDKNGDMLDSINEYSVHYKQLGYDADDFFNSLANGTEAGTFSVDKLGDAMKEFGIRTKDTAESTIEGFKLLGYGAGESAEEIEKTQTEIEKLEKNLKYAQIEQQGFNDKTSELTKLKNADKIKEYSEQLEAAKEKLANMTTETDSSAESISVLQARFAEGGEVAQGATQEILEKLFEMDDKVAQNQAGVALFGTMWEDLGKDGVKALMDTQGELKTTKKSMDEIKKIKYDDVMNDIEGIGRQFKMDVVQPILEKAVPKFRDALEWISDNLEDIIPIVEAVGGAMLTMFVVNKIATFIQSMKTLITTVKTLSTVTKAQTAAQTALNATNPFGWVALAITGVTALIGVFGSLGDSGNEWKEACKEIYEETKEQFSKLSAEEKALREKTDELTESYQDLKTAREESFSNVNAEYGYYDTLWDELQGIVDKNGAVKKGYEDRATVITEILSEALGTEITLTDNVIDKYGELVGTIDKVILSKKAEAIMSANESSYIEAIQKQSDAVVTMTENYAAWEQGLRDLETAETELAELQDVMWFDWAEQHEIVGSNAEQLKQYEAAVAAAEGKVDGLREKTTKSGEAWRDSKNAVEGYNATIQNYEGVSAAIVGGDTDEINFALLKLQEGFLTTESANKTSLIRQNENYKAHLETLEQAIKDGTAGVTQEQVDQFKKLVEASDAELAKLEPKAEQRGKNVTVDLSEGLESKLHNVQVAGENVSNTANKAIGSADTTKTSLNFVKGFYQPMGSTPVLNDVKAAGETVGDEAKDGIESVDTSESGTNFVSGFTNKLNSESVASTVWSAAAGVAQTALTALRNTFDENSPSKETEQSGDYFVKGLINGILGDENILIDTVNRIATRALETMRNGLDDDVLGGFSENLKNIKGVSANLSGKIRAGAAGAGAGADSPAAGATTYNFYQTNNSPKALSRFDIYRQSKNLLAAKGG